MPIDLRGLDPAAVLAASRDAARERRLAEVADLKSLAWWAALHSSDPIAGPDGRRQRRVGNVLRPVGGEGTPWVQDFCLGEIAMARGTGVTAATNAMADVLDLEHRLPLTWQVCQAGACEVSVARRVARMSRHLSAERVWVVDQAVARMIATEAGGRTIAVAAGKIIEADPDLHRRRVAEEKQRRFVGCSRTDEHGLRMVYARLAAGDVAAVLAQLNLIADLLAPRHPTLSRDELMALAFGYLARPAEQIILILEHTLASEPEDVEPEDVEPDPPEGPEPEEDEPFLNRALAFPADLLEALRAADFSGLRPRGVLYVHLHQGALHGADAVARVEDEGYGRGLGPVDLSTLQALLARTELVVKPVIDLSDRIRTTAYEHPESLKERIHLVTGGDYWPYATSTSRHVDSDHPTPFDHDADPPDEGGPPAQTGTHNSGPLGRAHHRWKTHARYRARQSGQGRYVITTPHGLAFLRDHRGTRPIPLADAEQIIDAGSSIDVYLPPVRVDLDP